MFSSTSVNLFWDMYLKCVLFPSALLIHQFFVFNPSNNEQYPLNFYICPPICVFESFQIALGFFNLVALVTSQYSKNFTRVCKIKKKSKAFLLLSIYFLLQSIFFTSNIYHEDKALVINYIANFWYSLLNMKTMNTLSRALFFNIVK